MVATRWSGRFRRLRDGVARGVRVAVRWEPRACGRAQRSPDRVNEIVCAERAIVHGHETDDFAFVVDDGIISNAGPIETLVREYPSHKRRDFGSDVLVVPGFIN